MSSTPLSTFLSTATTGAPATTASAMVSSLTPVQLIGTDGHSHYSAGTIAAVTALSTTQAKYDQILYPQPPGTPAGMSTGDLVGLMAQAVKENYSHLPIQLAATTSGANVATVDLTPYGLTVAPHVALTAINAAAVSSSVTSITNLSLSVITSIPNVNLQITLFP